MPRLTGSVPAPQSAKYERPTPTHVAARPRFTYAYHAGKHEVRGGHIVPVLRKVRGIPGVNGTDKTGDQRPMWDKLYNRGWTAIPEDVDGPGTSYLRVYATRNGEYYADRWQRVYPGDDKIDRDEEGYVAWLVDLMESGAVPRPERSVVERIRSGLASEHQQAIESGIAIVAARCEADIAVCDAYLASPTAPVAVPVVAEIPAPIELPAGARRGPGRPRKDAE